MLIEKHFLQLNTLPTHILLSHTHVRNDKPPLYPLTRCWHGDVVEAGPDTLPATDVHSQVKVDVTLGLQVVNVDVSSLIHTPGLNQSIKK